MKIRKTLHADDGMVLTNGEVYGTQISLEEGEDESSYVEITEERYQEILKEQEESYET